MKIEQLMTLENPTEALCGKRQSFQGFAIWKDIAFVAFHTGIVAAYDLLTKSPVPVDVFRYGSYNDGFPDNRYTNHANQGMFSRRFLTPDAEFPLLYVTAGNSGEQDEVGFIGHCAVESITRRDGKFTSECVQTIVYCNEGIEKTKWQTPGWGWPASFVDTETGFFYLFSARYRTKRSFSDYYERNNYIVTKFRLPDISEIGERVVLRPEDILDQIVYPYDVYFTQGGVLRDGKIWYTFGCGDADHPDAIRVYDLEAREIAARIDLSDSILGGEEVECCDFYNGRLIVNTNTTPGKLYAIELE